MRRKIEAQEEFVFHPSSLRVTNDYFQRYQAVDEILRGNRRILDLVHRDLEKPLKAERKRDRKFLYTSDHVLRILICQVVERATQRGVVVRVDDSPRLRRFTRIFEGPMMNFSTYCRLKNAIRPETWKEVNRALNQAAVEEERVKGEKLRLDTTAVETNIHYPSDSSLCFDVYRVLGRFVERARELDPEVVGDRRLQTRAAKRHANWITRKAGKKRTSGPAFLAHYKALFGLVEGLLEWSREVRAGLEKKAGRNAYGLMETAVAQGLVESFDHFLPLGERVLDQGRRRVLAGEAVPAQEKLYSIFEPHTELLKRGKAGKPIEFGHMVLFQQVEGKYITDYEVFRRRPNDADLVDPALESHRSLFGKDPEELAADKGFSEGSEQLDGLAGRISVVSIGKKGRRTEAEVTRESSEEFARGQRFRAGIEGTISFFKRALGLCRVLNKGWQHFVASVGASVFVHNLLVLARAPG